MNEADTLCGKQTNFVSYTKIAVRRASKVEIS
jgi:hypothetical protein